MIIIGHRGARKEAPENTLAGFRHLRSLGIHHVELDLHLSKDNKLVVVHDTTVNRTTNHSGNIGDFTAGELAKMNAAHNFPDWDSHTGIPLLDEILVEWEDLESIQLEVKPPSKDQFSVLAHELTTLITQHQLEQRAIVTSSDAQFLAYMQNQFPAFRRGLVAERFSRNPVGVCNQLHCCYLVLDWRRCSKKLVTSAHAAGLHVSTWTVNTISAAKKVTADGVDSIITDVPSTLLHL